MIKIDRTSVLNKEDAIAAMNRGRLVYHESSETFYRVRQRAPATYAIESAPVGTGRYALDWNAAHVLPAGTWHFATYEPDEPPATAPVAPPTPEGYISATESEARAALNGGAEVWEETEHLWWRREGSRYQFRYPHKSSWNASPWLDPVEPRRVWKGAWFVRETKHSATPVPPYRPDPKRRIFALWPYLTQGEVIAFVPTGGAPEFYRRDPDPDTSNDFQRYHHSGETWRPCADTNLGRLGAWYVAEDCNPKSAAPKRELGGLEYWAARADASLAPGALETYGPPIVYEVAMNAMREGGIISQYCNGCRKPHLYRIRRGEVERWNARGNAWGIGHLEPEGGDMRLCRELDPQPPRENVPAVRAASGTTTGTCGRTLTIAMGSNYAMPDRVVLTGPTGRHHTEYVRARGVPSADRSRPLGRPK